MATLSLSFYNMRKLLFWFGALLPCTGLGQASLSGVINRYAAITDINYCSSTLSVNQPANFNVNDLVLIIQMKGAVINATNTSAFGAVAQINAAGLYEFARVQSITGNNVRLQNALVNSYNITGNVQLVYVPEVTNATATGMLSALPWDGSIGGVLAIKVTDTLILEADVEVSAQGFRGGVADITQNNSCSWALPQNGFFYPLNNWRGAAKGEGIAAFLNGAEAGRGPQANGGGGGNDHNSGGGGGGHVQQGGRGGTNEEPATFGCSGNFPGLGGNGLGDTWPATRIFMGGGGGAGHENNNLGTDGGQGGGIIIIEATVLQGNGYALKANGSQAAQSLSDGAGGGGAGGTIVLKCGQVSDLRAEARGGNGGNANNANGNRCMGPGGGGAGGRIILTSSVGVQTDVSPGTHGLSIQSTVCATGPNGAQSGQAGLVQVVSALALPQGDMPLTPPTVTQQPAHATACVGDTVTLSVQLSGSYTGLQWQVNTGSGFQNIVNNATYSGAQTLALTIANVGPALSGYQYSLRIQSACFPATGTLPATLTVNAAPVAGFDFVVNGASVQFSNTSVAANAWQWRFGDGSVSQEQSPVHTYTAGGNYEVMLVATNACGADTIVRTVQVLLAPVADFLAFPTAGCAPLEVSFNSGNSTFASTYTWQFPGGQPVVSSQPDPTVLYNQPGSYSVTLIASNAAGADTLTRPDYIRVWGAPSAAFGVQSVSGLTAQFTNTSQGADTYQWNFGDGQTSTMATPQHTYAAPGIYTVTLTASNICGSRTFTLPVTIGQLPQAAFGQSISEGCAPMVVQFNDLSAGTYTSRQWTFPGGNPASSAVASPVVVYAQPGVYPVTLALDGPLGGAAITQPNAVTVYTYPEPSFTYSVQGLTVAFQNTSQHAVSYAWFFGDGNTSQAVSPTHTYAAPGVYTVTLNAQRPFCAATTSATVLIMPNAAGEHSLPGKAFVVFPNPMRERLWIRRQDPNAGSQGFYRLWSMAGSLVRQGYLSQQAELDVAELPAGAYLLEITADGAWEVHKVLR